MNATRELSRDVIEARLERDQRELAAVVGGLRERIRMDVERLDPRRRIEARPTAWLFGAMLVGLWFGVRR